MYKPHLHSALVRVLTDNQSPRNPVGAGFLVFDRHFLTCAHVVCDALGIPRDTVDIPDAPLFLDFPLLPGHPLVKTAVLKWFPVRESAKTGDVEDIAVLELLSDVPLPLDACPAGLVLPEVFDEHKVRMCGFPKGMDEGDQRDCKISGLVGTGLIQIDFEVGRRTAAPGFSGTPVWDTAEKSVCGMIVSINTRDHETSAYMIPAATLIRAFPELKRISRPANSYKITNEFSPIDNIALSHQHFDVSAMKIGPICLNNPLFESLQNTLSSHNKKILEECRELVRKGKNKEAFRQVKEIRNSQEWLVLNKEIQADILAFEASLALQIDRDIKTANQLVLQAKEYYPQKDMTIIQALLSYYEKDAEAALNEIQHPDNIEKINLKAGILLEIGKLSEAISFIKNIPKKIPQNAETIRLLSLAYLASGKLSHARYEIQKAINEKPDWLGIRIASAMINYFSALSPAALPHGLPTFPDPIGLNLINRDDESLSRLRHAEELFRQIAKDMKDETESRKTFQIWRLACLFNHPDRQTEAHEFCHDLLKDGKAHTGVIIWAVVQNIDYDFSEYKREYENRLKFDDIETDQIIALLLIYVHSEDTGKALSLLDQTKDNFSSSPDPLLWLFWKAQTLLKSGDIRTALTLAESSGDHRFQQTVFALALKYAEPESEEWQYILSFLEPYAKESADGEMLFRICSAKAGIGDQKSWEMWHHMLMISLTK